MCKPDAFRGQVAALDPIFWVHHCNVDRFAAIWQTLYDSQWFDDAKQQLVNLGTWSIPAEPKIHDTPKTSLAPFHKHQDGEAFDSNDVRYLDPFGYTYPELKRWDLEHQVDGQFNQEKYLQDIRAAITDLYDLTAPMFLSKPKRSLLSTTGVLQVVQAAQTVLTGSTKEETHDDYIADVLYDKNAHHLFRGFGLFAD